MLRAQPDLLLDMYLAPHVERLIVRIRDRALIQYFRCVPLLFSLSSQLRWLQRAEDAKFYMSNFCSA